MLFSWHGGFSELKGTPENNWRWCSQTGELVINNEAGPSKRIKLEMSLRTGYEEPANLRFTGSLFSEQLKINSASTFFSKTVIVPPGRHLVRFACDAKRIEAPTDRRVLVFGVDNFRLVEEHRASQENTKVQLKYIPTITTTTTTDR